jgi:hypothetical protein
MEQNLLDRMPVDETSRPEPAQEPTAAMQHAK